GRRTRNAKTRRCDGTIRYRSVLDRAAGDIRATYRPAGDLRARDIRPIQRIDFLRKGDLILETAGGRRRGNIDVRTAVGNRKNLTGEFVVEVLNATVEIVFRDPACTRHDSGHCPLDDDSLDNTFDWLSVNAFGKWSRTVDCVS